MSTPAAARSVADIHEGLVLATVEIAAPPQRVFKAITEDVAKWWGSDRSYRVTKWKSDLRVGGQWRSEGAGSDGTPFAVEGEYLEIAAPQLLVTTWRYDWGEKRTTKLTYRLQEIPTGTKITVRHEGFGGQHEDCNSHAEGWQMVLSWLVAFAEG